MKVFLIILILLLAAVLQVTAVPFLSFKGVSPNLVLVIVLFLVIFKGFKQVWLGVLMAGLFLDFFSGLAFGLTSLSLIFTVFLIDWFNKKVFSQINFWVIVVLIGLGNLIYYLLLWGLKSIL